MQRTSILIRQIIGMNDNIIGIRIVAEAYRLKVGVTF